MESKLLSSAHGLTPRSKATLATENATSHFHKWGQMRASFEKMEPLTKLFKIVATARDANGDEFVDIIEGHDYPIYGIA